MIRTLKEEKDQKSAIEEGGERSDELSPFENQPLTFVAFRFTQINGKQTQIQMRKHFGENPVHFSTSSSLIGSSSTRLLPVHWLVMSPVTQCISAAGVAACISRHHCAAQQAAVEPSPPGGSATSYRLAQVTATPPPPLWGGGDPWGCGCGAFFLTFGEQVEDTMADGR